MKVKLTCKSCGREFLRNKGEVNRNAKRCRNTYCSRKCGGVANCNHLKDYLGNYDISKHCKNKLDGLSGFRDLLKKSKANSKKNGHEFSITLENLRDQFDKQKGVCPYTGWKLVMPENTSKLLPRSHKKASVDRIDSSKGYVVDNIQIVSLMAQYAKNDFTEPDLLEFCSAVVSHRSNFCLSRSDNNAKKKHRHRYALVCCFYGG